MEIKQIVSSNEKDKFRGCLIGGAIGDALGMPVEFMSLEEIIANFGPNGITNLIKGKNGVAEITDDTQMTMFTAEGILRAEATRREVGRDDTTTSFYKSYLRWLMTQGYSAKIEKDGWLIKIKELYKKQAPGHTCIASLLSGQMGTVDKKFNDSKGCGGVMRTAPIGLFYDKDLAFKLGCECAAITHSHPSGYLSAGVLSNIISSIIEGEEIETAVTNSLEVLMKQPDHGEVSKIMLKAIKLANESTDDIQAIKTLGEGWIGEQALAISLYCALKYKHNFEKALIVAVNHSGDSDSTGAITGNILGAYQGISKIPPNLIDAVEFSEELQMLADDLVIKYEDTEEWEEKYPVDKLKMKLERMKIFNMILKKPSKELLLNYYAYHKEDSIFSSNARLRQSIWRAENLLLKEMGIDTSTGKYWGNLIPINLAKKEGLNFLNEQIFTVVKSNVNNKETNSLIQEPRIWNNMLSSQPLCFNLFAELSLDLNLATELFTAMFPDKVKQVTGIKFEYSPGRGKEEFTNDLSAFDVFIEYQSCDNKKGFIGIEVKYAEKMDNRPSKHKSSHEKIMLESRLFDDKMLTKLKSKPIQQIWRDHLLALSMYKISEYYDEGMFVFLFPQHNAECRNAITEYRKTFLVDNNEEDNGFYPRTLEEVITILKDKSKAEWINIFDNRYLNF